MVSESRIHLVNFCRKLAVNAVFFLVALHFLKLGFKGWQIGTVNGGGAVLKVSSFSGDIQLKKI